VFLGTLGTGHARAGQSSLPTTHVTQLTHPRRGTTIKPQGGSGFKGQSQKLNSPKRCFSVGMRRTGRNHKFFGTRLEFSRPGLFNGAPTRIRQESHYA
jgi:hypothetical protein